MTAATHQLEGSTVLVTGGCGFIGAELVRALLSRGAGEVRVIDDLRCGADEDLLEAREDPRLRIAHLALGDASREALRPLVAGCQLVFHLAAEKGAHATTDRSGMLRANLQGTQDLLEECAQAEVQKVVYTSSVMAYGRRHEPPLTEADLPTPTTIYGVTKLAGEHLLRTWGREHGREWSVLRCFFVYGPRQYVGKGYRSVFVRTGKRLLNGEAPEIYGDGQQAFDYVYNDDVVEAILRAMQAPVSGEVFNVGSGKVHRIADVISRLVETSGLDATPVHGPADATAGTFRVANITKIRERLGWEPKITLDEGLARTYAWLAEEHGTQQ